MEIPKTIYAKQNTLLGMQQNYKIAVYIYDESKKVAFV